MQCWRAMMTNNRFRFRVWDKNGDSYISEKDDADFLYLGENGKLTIGLYNDDVDDITYLKEEDLIIEQCTGLKDKNGRLIYEGDVVSCGHPDIGYVKWKDGGFWVSGWNYVIPWNFFTTHKWEVLGNIHENQELLRRKK